MRAPYILETSTLPWALSAPDTSGTRFGATDLAGASSDLFDQILIAQTITEGFAMIASDDAIHKYALSVVW